MSLKNLVIKQILFLFAMISISVSVFCQSMAINTTGATANASAILDVSAANKGLLVPRMTTTQRLAIATPANGLLVYDNDSLSFAYFNGIVWNFLKGTNNIYGAWGLKGNNGTIDGTNFIGTTDNVPLNFRVNNNIAGRIDATNANVFLGSRAGGNNSTPNNTAIGHFALLSNISGENNVAVGKLALGNTSSGNNNIAIGNNAIGTANTIESVAIGNNAMYQGYGIYNVAIGSEVLSNFANGSYSVGIGYQSLRSSNGAFNTATGYLSMLNNSTGTNNTSSGSYSMYNNTTGYENTVIGNNALSLNTSGYRNVANGSYSMYSNSTGYENTVAGYKSLYSNTTGANNTVIGSQSLYTNTTGSYNTALGVNSLPSVNSGDYNTGMGYAADVSNTLTNATAVGAFAKATQSNSMVLGSINGINGATANTNVGIGTTSPNAPLQFSNNPANRKIVLFDFWNNDNQYDGFGFSANSLRYQTGDLSIDHTFYAGISSTTSNELMRITGLGKVGIGTPSPLNPLTINFTGTVAATSSSYALAIQQAGSTDITLGSNSNAFLQTWNSKPLLINSQGNNVGIGVGAAPSAKLDVNGALLVESAQATHAQGVWLEWNKDGASGKSYLLNQKGLGSGGFVFGEVDAANAITERININNNGNVGIGQPAPPNPLTINSTGTVAATTASYALAIQQAGSTDITLGSNSNAFLQTWNSKPLLINSQGNSVGIGLSTAPSAKLDVNGALLVESAQASHAQGVWLEWNKDGGSGKSYVLNQKGGGSGGFVFGEVDNANAVTERMVIDNSGNVGIGTTGVLLQKFVVNGNGVFTGTVVASCGVLVCSDVRYKKDIQPLQNSLSKIMQLNGVSYYFKKEEFKDKNFNNNKQVGLIAQEVEKIFPELVQTDAQGFKSIDYAKLTPVLVEAVKELQIQNNILKDDNLLLKALLVKMEARLEKIEKPLNPDINQ